MNVEIGGDGLFALADQIALVGLEAVQGEAVLVRVDGDGADAHLRRRAHDADRYLAAIGYQQLLDAAAHELPPQYVLRFHRDWLRTGLPAGGNNDRASAVLAWGGVSRMLARARHRDVLQGV